MTYLYTYNDGQLTGEVITTNGSAETLYYSYDASGTPVSVKYNNTLYFYLTNLQGDVIAIMNGSGTIVVEYTYDAWGYIRNTTGSLKDTLGKANALRYRGYVYDTETCLYYLQSRYYNPGTGRFINADALVSTGKGILGNNMFAYCRNNPIRRKDVAGCVEEDCIDGNPLPDDEDVIGSPASSGSPGGSGAPPATPPSESGARGLEENENSSIAKITGQLQIAADNANASVNGSGARAGTLKHTAFKNNVNALNNKNLRTEVSYQNQTEVQYGTKGSIRFDVVYYENDKPVYAWDFKTGDANLTPGRIDYMRSISGFPISIDMIK